MRQRRRPCYTACVLPAFLRALADPAVRTVLLCGCGGGFDFLHGLTLLPELVRLGKRIVIGSYSFGDPARIGEAPTVLDLGAGALVKRVSAHSAPPPDYAPEVHLCSYLDAQLPGRTPHAVYAYYARAFTVPRLSALYRELCRVHDVDAVVLFDGGSDSLMAGDEEGLGDPIEDAVSIAAVAGLSRPRLKLLVSIGLGADRFNQVSDAASLRAIAELTAAGGFRGALSLEPDSAALDFYRGAIEHVYARQTFRSALTGFILAAAAGHYGGATVPAPLPPRVRPGGFFLWPLMAMLWAFDVEAVARRSRIVGWIRECQTVSECHLALHRQRAALGAGLRPVEELPRHADLRGR